tara:strand:+ start:1185 stop:1976 length:792 start_codon:yes stop_codon:yes gene_type:complete
MLTVDQKEYWEAFGYITLPNVFSENEMSLIHKSALEVIEKEATLGVLDDSEGWSIGGFLERHPYLSSLLEDDRIYGIAETLLGSDFILEMTDGHVRGGDTAWHGRDPSKDPSSCPNKTARIGMYFDELDEHNGCLRVIPGSHKRPFADNLAQLWGQQEDPEYTPFGVVGTDIPCVYLRSKPGDIVVFTESVYHASFGGHARLQLTAQFVANPKNEDQLDEVINNAGTHKWGYHPARSAINSDKPRVRRMVSRLVELGFSPLEV